MGLSLSVGYLADVFANDPEGSSVVSRDFENLNTALASANCKPHEEPTRIDTSSHFSCEMWGYSGLHHLRRIAAHAAFGFSLPQPAGIDASQDTVLKRYYAEVTQPPSFISRLFGSRRGDRLGYQHLIVHSDAEGYYIPQDFQNVIFTDDDLKIPGGMIGSTFRLREECTELAKLLEIPAGLDIESEEVWEAADDPSAGTATWQRYGIETFSCIRLLAACEASIRVGAAIVFC
jgi:hypothetical protein